MAKITIWGNDGKPLTHLTQWDNNRDVTVKGLKVFDQPPEFHFWDRDRYRAIVVPSEIVDGGVKAHVPNILLQSDDDVIFTVYDRTLGNEGRSVYIRNIPVLRAQKPEDYDYTDNIDYISFTELIKEAEALLEMLRTAGDEVVHVSNEALEAATKALEQATAASQSASDAEALAKQFADQLAGFLVADDSQTTDKNLWTAKKIREEIDKGGGGEKQVFTAVISNEVGRLVCDMTASEIIDASRKGVVKAEYTDEDSGETREYYYFKQMPDGRAVFTKDGYIEAGVPKQTLFYVDFAGNVEVETRSAAPDAAYAVCHDPAAPPSSTANTWYIPKSMPRPSGNVGMMVDVYWENGRVSGLGYNASLIWGEPDGPDNEVIVSGASITDTLTGEHSIPTEGTVRYQLEETSGRMHWRYVSGGLIPTEFSTATDAATADKLVPGLALGYLPGMEIYVQMDNGNSADLMQLVPDEGETLPVYGNSVGAHTGEIPAGYILHLKNAGDHWQIINAPGGKGGAINDATVSSASTWSSSKIVDVVLTKANTTGAVVVVKNAKADLSAVSILTDFPLSQEGGGTPSPSNIRKINLHAGNITLHHTGENMCNPKRLSPESHNIYGYLQEYGQPPLRLRKGIRYAFDVRKDIPSPTTIWLKKYESYGTNITSVDGSSRLEYTPDADMDVCFNVYWENGRPSLATNISITTGEYSDLAYDGSTIEATVPAPFCCGYIDWKTGSLNETWKLLEFDGSPDENWTVGDSYYFTIPAGINPDPKTIGASNKYTYKASYNKSDVFVRDDGLLYIGRQITDSFNRDINMWKSELKRSPLQVAVKIKVPVVAKVCEPYPAISYAGTNTFYANAGIMNTVVYTTLSPDGRHEKTSAVDACGLDFAVKDYFAPEVSTTVDAILGKMTKPCLVLTWVTDSHDALENSDIERRTKDTFTNIRAVTSRVPTYGIIHTGDFVQAGVSEITQQDSDRIISKTRGYALESSSRVYMVSGNHDGPKGGAPKSTNYNCMSAQNQSYVTRRGNSNYFYSDIEFCKVRLIGLDTNDYYSGATHWGIGPDQLAWVKNALASTPNDWNIIVFSHIGPFNTEDFVDNRTTITKEFNSYNAHSGSYSAKNGMIMCWLVGHEHFDWIAPKKNTGCDFPVVVSTASALYAWKPPTSYEGAVAPERIDKTASQDAWTTVIYIPEEKTIHFIRFGAGNNRGITWKNGLPPGPIS